MFFKITVTDFLDPEPIFFSSIHTVSFLHEFFYT